MKNKLKITTFSVFFLSALLITGCKSKSEKELHPMEVNIPKYDLESLSIAKENSVDSESLPQLIKTLISELESPNQNKRTEFKGLNLTDNTKLLSLNKNRLLILETEEDKLTELNLRTGITNVLAKRGRGPGDLFISSDITNSGDYVFIANRDGRISKFDCSYEPCGYVKLITLEDVVPISITSDNSDGFTVLGNNKLPPQKKAESDTPIASTAIWNFDKSGKLESSFGEHYNIQNKWMLQKSFSAGIIDYDVKRKNYFMSFEAFPFIYVFNELGKAIQVLEVQVFTKRKQVYDTKAGSLSATEGDFSLISEMEVHDESFVFLKIKTFKNRRVVSKIFEWDIRWDYYLIDLDSFKPHFLGSQNSTGEYILTENNLILVDEKNKLFVIEG